MGLVRAARSDARRKLAADLIARIEGAGVAYLRLKVARIRHNVIKVVFDRGASMPISATLHAIVLSHTIRSNEIKMN